MTGQQVNPGTNLEHYSEGIYKKQIPLAKIIESTGVDLDIYQKIDDNQKHTIRLRNLIVNAGLDVLNNKKTHVILIQDECIQKSKKRYTIQTRFVDSELCTNCGICYRELACPSISLQNEKAYIDPGICLGCGVCEQECPKHAIHIRNDGD
jgi:indolepyruvate ferredoxin oxidoreductase alpha subunit